MGLGGCTKKIECLEMVVEGGSWILLDCSGFKDDVIAKKRPEVL